MKVQGVQYRTVWAAKRANGLAIKMIDQRRLPHRFEIAEMPTHRETARGIKEMVIRGAPAIGAAGAYGLAQAVAEAPLDPPEGRSAYVLSAHETLRSTRPTAYDLFYSLDRVMREVEDAPAREQADLALAEAERLADESAERCRRIGEQGQSLIEDGMRVLTHCNAGWLAAVDWGMSLAPVYAAHRAGRKVSVFADETRPRLQGANLTAWELAQEGVPCEIIPDNAAGLFMRRGEVQLVITGADRIAVNGDAANKIGTYEKALLAREHGIPFYIAAPASTFDANCPDGGAIPIEERSEDEVLFAYGRLDGGELGRVRVAPEGARARNPAFDVTPASLIAGLITEQGIIQPNERSIRDFLSRRM